MGGKFSPFNLLWVKRETVESSGRERELVGNLRGKLERERE